MAYDLDDGKVPSDSIARKIMEFVRDSSDYRDEFSSRWEETLANYCVIPWNEVGWSGMTGSPLGINSGRHLSMNAAYSDTSTMATGAILKDPESLQITETILASLWGTLFGSPGYVRTSEGGAEDTRAAMISGDLLSYSFALPGHAKTSYQWLKDGLLFGTGIVEDGWHYVEGAVNDRTIESYLSMSGVEELAIDSPRIDSYYNDPRARNVDLLDFFPDPSVYMMCDMSRCAKRFSISVEDAKARADWDQAAVRRAIQNHGYGISNQEREDKGWREGIDRASMEKERKVSKPLTGYQYFGHCPWDTSKGPGWHKIVVLCGEVVSDPKAAWPFKSQRLPFFDFSVNPIQGRFYGVSPIEANRYTQDMTDAILMNMAVAISRSTHPPHIVDRNATVDIAKLKRWRPDVPIIADRVDAVQQIPYNPPLQPAFAFLQQLKSSMREASGALGAIQGLGLGVDRASASEAQATFQRAGARTEMMASLIEQDPLPQWGQFRLELYQRFLDDPREIEARIGTKHGPVSLSEIHAVKDVRFVGSRLVHNKRTKLENIERFVQVWAPTPVAAMVPWVELMKIHADALEVPEVKALIADPQMTALNLMLQQATGPNKAAGNGNGEQAALDPSGMMPEQTGGGALIG